MNTRHLVRLRRSMWSDDDGIYQKIELRTMKRITRDGYPILVEESRNCGADLVFGSITNLHQSPDGLYWVGICNEYRDYETGHMEDWDYVLIPHNENETT